MDSRRRAISQISLESAPHHLSKDDLQSALSQTASGETVLRFYYLDAIESDVPGKIYVFGKIFFPPTSRYISCCVLLPHIPRRIHILPTKADEDSLNSAEEAFAELAEKFGVTDYTVRVVRKKYAFNIEGVPEETDYLEVRYPFTCRKLPQSSEGSAIEQIFGTSASALEILLTERGMRGPSWLEIKSPVFDEPQDNETWCRCQVSCHEMEALVVMRGDRGEQLEIPPIVLTTLNIRTQVLDGNGPQVVLIHMSTQTNFDISGASAEPPVLEDWLFMGDQDVEDSYLREATSINVALCSSPTDLLEKFCKKMLSLDPDVLMGFDCGVSWIILIRKIVENAVKTKSKDTIICRVKDDVRKLSGLQTLGLRKILYRPMCDVKLAINEINSKLTQGDFDGICSRILGTEVGYVRSIPSWEFIECFRRDCPPEKTLKLIEITKRETGCVMRMARQMNLLPLAVEMTTIAGHVLWKTLAFLRNERSAFLLIHAFHEAGYIIPNMQQAVKTGHVEGGLVLPAEVGLHEDISLLMDFRSLYPSIIQEYNLCFSTMPGVCYKPFEDVQINPEAPLGVLPGVVGRIVERRKEAKRLLKDPATSPGLKLNYQARQTALKLVVNTLYGCLGSNYFQFYAPNIAATITARGREILGKAVDIVESLGFQVIYGDTDSVMINTRQKDRAVALATATSIRELVNGDYRCIELEHERTFKYVVVTSRKLYTGFYYNDLPDGSTELVLESKGNLVKEKYSCDLVDTTVKYVLNEIFNEGPLDRRVENIEAYLKEIGRRRNDEHLEDLVPSLVITKQLLHAPETSPDTRAPHVDLAIRLNAKQPNTWREGHFISYIICLDGTNKPPNQRSYLKDTKYKPDVEYYLVRELLPAFERLCKPIPELTADILADFLGVKNEYQRQATNGRSEGIDGGLWIPIEEFSFECRKCGERVKMSGFNKKERSKYVPVLSSCPTADCDFAPWRYVDDIIRDLEEHIFDFVKKHPPRIVCTSGTCDWFTLEKMMPRVCPKCRKHGSLRRDLPVAAYYGRVNLLRRWFDVEGQRDVRQKLRPELVQAYKKIHKFLVEFMEASLLMIVREWTRLKTPNLVQFTREYHFIKTVGNEKRLSSDHQWKIIFGEAMGEVTTHEAFFCLKPLCDLLVRDPNKQNAKNVCNYLGNLPRSVVQNLMDYVLFPPVLHLGSGASTETRLHLLTVIETVLQRVRILKIELFFKLYSILLRQVQDAKQPIALIPEHEELKMSVMISLKYLFLSASSDIIEAIYTRDNSLKLSECFFLCVSIAKSEKYSKLRIAATEALMTLAYVHDEAEVSDVVLRSQVADVVMLYLPGIVRGMLDIAEGSETQNHKVTLMAIRALGRVIALVMEDSPDESSPLTFPMLIPASTPSSPDPLGLQSNLNNKTDKEKYLQMVRNADWLKAASEKLTNPLKNLSNSTKHSHPRVRRELLSAVSLLITKCTRNLGEAVPDLIDVVITLSEDNETEVSDPAKVCLTEINQAIVSSRQMRSITSLLEENFYRLLTKLPRIMRRSESSAQLSYLNQLTGYLRIFGEERLPRIMSSLAHLRRLLLALIYVIELDCRAISVLDDNHIATIEDTVHLSTTSWKKFKFISDESVHQKLIIVCTLLGDLGDVDILIDSIIQLMSDMPQYQKELTLLINWTCTSSNRSLKALYPQLINHYIDDDLWYLKIEMTSGTPLSQLQSNIVQNCLLMEGLGVFASMLKADYQQFLLKTLYLIIERAGNKNRLISSIGLQTLEEFATSQGYPDLTNFLRDNVDYISYNVTIKLRRLERNLGVLDVVTIVMKYSTLDFLPCLKEIVVEALGQLKIGAEASNSYSILRVLYTFILCIRRQVCEQKTREDEVERPAETADRVIQAVVEYSEAKRVNKLVDDNAEASDTEAGRESYDQQDDEASQCAPGVEAAEPEPPAYIKLVEDVMKCSLNFVPSRTIPETLIAMEILQGGIDILSPWTDQLLPIVHQLWHPLVDRFKESNVLIMNRAWQLLFTVARASEDFVRSRTLDKVSPSIAKFLEIAGKESYGKDCKGPYGFTQMFKLQRMILSQLGTIAGYLKLQEKQLWQLLDMTETYLHFNQHPVLQECCVEMYKNVFRYNGDVVWVKCLSIWSSRVKRHSGYVVPSADDFNAVGSDSAEGSYGKNTAILLKYIDDVGRRELNVV